MQQLLCEIGMAKDAAKKFSLYSFRSGAAAQALANAMALKGGVSEITFLQAIARILGHITLTRTTLNSYIRPLGDALNDNSAVVHGEKEGVVGGIADYEGRMLRLPQYSLFVHQEPLTEAERTKRASNGALIPPKLPHEVSRVVDVE